MGTLVLQAVVSGILTGGVYALMAAGLTLIFGVMDIINVAQGILVVLGAYLSYVLSVHLGVDLFLGLLVTVPAMFVVGVLIQWVFISRLGERERTAMSILATYSVAIIIEGVLGLIFGEDYVQLNAWYVNQSFRVFGFYLPYIYVFGFLLAGGLPGRALSDALPHSLWQQREGDHAGPPRRATGWYRREPCGGHHLRDRGLGYGRRGDGVRRHELVQPEHRVRPHFPPAGHRHPGRPGQYRRGIGGCGSRTRRRRRGGRRLVAHVGAICVFRHAHRRVVRQAVGALRPGGGTGAVTRPGLAKAAGVLLALAVLVVFPLVFTNPSVTTIAVFTLLFMASATAWNGFLRL